MTPAHELELFAQLRGLPRFAEWLGAQEAQAVTVLKSNLDLAAIHQAQGKAQLIDRMKNMLAGANKPLR